MSERVILEMTPNTARIVQAACEFYARAMWGQTDYVVDEIADGLPYSRVPAPKAKGREEAFNAWLEARDRAKDSAKIAKAALFPELTSGASYGVRCFRDADLAVHVWQTLRYVRAWHDHPEGGITVDFNRPMIWVSDEPLPKCRIEGNDED